MKNYLENQIEKFVGNKKCEQLDVTELNIDKVICLLETSILSSEGRITKQMEAVARTVFRLNLIKNEYGSVESYRMYREVANLFETLFPNQDIQEVIDFIQDKEILNILEESKEEEPEKTALFLLKFESDWSCSEYYFLKQYDFFKGISITVFEIENGRVTTNFNTSEFFESKYNVQFDIELPVELRKAIKMEENIMKKYQISRSILEKWFFIKVYRYRGYIKNEK